MDLQLKKRSIVFCLFMVLCAYLYSQGVGLPTSIPGGTQVSVIKNQVIIAPPPVGYPEFEAGESSLRWGVHGIYAATQFDNQDFALFGASILANYQKDIASWASFSAYGGLSFARGTEFGFTVFQVPLQAMVVVQPVKTKNLSLFGFVGGGASPGLSFMTILLEIGDAEVITYSLAGSVNGGAQGNVTIGSWIFSPFAVFSYSGGGYSAELSSSLVSLSESGSSPSITTSIYGFDLLYKPLGMSLSSMFQKNSLYSLWSLTFRWALDLLKKKGATP
jgi:hypothetical protein